MTVLLFAAAALASIDTPAVRAVARCRYQSGAVVTLTRASGHAYELLFARPDGLRDLSEIRVTETGQLEIESNGGVWSINAIDALFRELAQQSSDGRGPDAPVALCRSPYKDGTR